MDDRKRTKYRITSNGYRYFLEYQKTVKHFFGLIKCKEWWRVGKPYYDKIWGRDDVDGHNTTINAYNTDVLTRFTNKWPYIEDYYAVAQMEQTELERKAHAYREKMDERKRMVINL